jgi:hypothetical protein
MRVRAVPSGTRREYIPVGSTAASLPLKVPECTTRTHVTAANAPG